MRTLRLALMSLLVASSLVGCVTDPDDPTAADIPDDFLDTVPPDGAFDGFDATGPSVAAGGETEVWAVRNQWDDTNTTAARAAGMAWEANSGLTWEQKFDRWVASFELVPRAAGYGQTVHITTPFGGRSFDAPTLECAEVALFLRATFSAWFNLPFYVQGWDAAGRQTLYAGHFGFINRTGVRIDGFPRFRTAYPDHTSRFSDGMSWPSDARLRALRLGTDDAVTFLSEDGVSRGAGAYFDELHLNKRVGYFLRLLLLYFGSGNLADGANTFAVTAAASDAGDILIHRWQRRGIGHVLPIFRRGELGEGRFELLHRLRLDAASPADLERPDGGALRVPHRRLGRPGHGVRWDALRRARRRGSSLAHPGVQRGPLAPDRARRGSGGVHRRHRDRDPRRPARRARDVARLAHARGAA